MQRFFVSIMLSAAVMLILLDGTYGQSDYGGGCKEHSDCFRFCDTNWGYCIDCEGDKDCDSSKFCYKRSRSYEYEYQVKLTGECRTIECEKHKDCNNPDKLCNYFKKKCYVKDHECYIDYECGDNRYCEKNAGIRNLCISKDS
uniref:uncharacterized protein LOC120347853 isoform X3 n=1 Tax=Styela clava TaxID=7725 RepID=UPI00193996CE|nr:uncharacterized protein LOC120347853 isoform X3 [Styela clava]